MASLPGIKYDDGSGAHVTNCFPVRSINSISEEGSGAWLVAHRAEQRKQFKALLCAKPRTYEEIRQERRRAEKNGTAIMLPPTMSLEETEEEVVQTKVLDGFFLMKLFCVDDPSDLCSINISGQLLSDVKEEDFSLFDNIAYVNAAENFLTVNQFRHFVTIRELELPLNGIRGIEITPNTFPHLEMLDLSYNNLTPEDILPLGDLPQLKVLHLTGNGLFTLPPDFAGPVTLMTDSERDGRFHKLEILLLDDNSFSNVDVFAALAGLRNLKHLNLSKNSLYAIPQLVLVRGHHVPTEFPEKPVSSKSRKSQLSSRKTSSKGPTKTPEKEPEKPATETAPQPPVEDTKEEPKEPDFSTDLPEDLELTELNLNDIDAKVEEEMEQEEMEREQEALAANENLPPVRMPFPELRYLNVAFNKVEEEEHLLAVSTWPMLTELVIHDNPLTSQSSHMPQMLQMFLADQLGIHVQRKKDGPIPKPVFDIPQKPGRKVSTAVERVPKCSIEEILALESGQSLFEHDKPHDERRRHSLEEPLQQPKQSPHPRHSTKDRLPPIRRSQHMTGGEEVEEQTPGGVEDEPAGDAFFMTQFLTEDTETKTGSKEEVTTERSARKDGKEMKKKRKKPEEVKVKEVDDRYKGYELLLDIDESALDPDIPIPKDLHGNVRALRYMLEHPLVYRENTIHLERRQKPFEPYRRRGMSLGAKRKMRPEQIEDVLSTLRNRTCVIEAPLKDVLTHPRKYHKDFGNARQLLSEVQRKFNAVRENSMKDARREMKNIVSETIKVVEQLNGQQSAIS